MSSLINPTAENEAISVPAGLDRHELLKQWECSTHRWKSSYATDLYGVLEPCVEFHLDAPVFPHSVQDHPQEQLPQTLQNPGVHNNQKDHAHGHSALLHMQSITTLKSPIYLENMLPSINLCVKLLYYYSMSLLSLNEASNYLVRFSLTSDSLRMTRVSSRYFIRGATAWSSSSKRTYIEKHIRP